MESRAEKGKGHGYNLADSGGCMAEIKPVVYSIKNKYKLKEIGMCWSTAAAGKSQYRNLGHSSQNQP